ncbi:MAG: hypothetical protein R3B47_20595 [Bacteroidia bacterium]
MMKSLPSFLILISLFFACTNNNGYVYDVNTVDVLGPGVEKGKEKTIDQFLSILHANLFQKAISPDEMVEIRRLIESIGDKELALEIVISNFMNRPDVVLPTDEYMRENIPAFIEETYERFFVRPPTEAEKTFIVNMIENDPNFSAEMVYFSFALSEEYRFY